MKTFNEFLKQKEEAKGQRCKMCSKPLGQYHQKNCVYNRHATASYGYSKEQRVEKEDC